MPLVFRFCRVFSCILRKRRCFATTVSASVSAVLLCCFGGTQPADPISHAVWADDCSSIACAINHADYDSDLFENSSTNERYDIVLYNADGSYDKTIISSRRIDSCNASVAEMFFMKTRGYVLVKSLLHGCGGYRFDMISMDGKITQLFQVGSDSGIDEVSMIPSLNGTYIARIRKVYSASPTCDVTFFDSTGLGAVDTFENVLIGWSHYISWSSDSTLEIKSTGVMTLQPLHEMRGSGPIFNATCNRTVTSSSAFCPNKGYVFFNSSSRSISKEPKPPSYMNICE